MIVTIGMAGIEKTWQAPFPMDTKCCRCGGKAQIGFVAHEGLRGEGDDNTPEHPIPRVFDLHDNQGKGNYWLHDRCAVAVYFCRDCLEPTALYNQG